MMALHNPRSLPREPAAERCVRQEPRDTLGVEVDSGPADGLLPVFAAIQGLGVDTAVATRIQINRQSGAVTAAEGHRVAPRPGATQQISVVVDGYRVRLKSARLLVGFG